MLKRFIWTSRECEYLKRNFWFVAEQGFQFCFYIKLYIFTAPYGEKTFYIEHGIFNYVKILCEATYNESLKDVGKKNFDKFKECYKEIPENCKSNLTQATSSTLESFCGCSYTTSLRFVSFSISYLAAYVSNFTLFLVDDV